MKHKELMDAANLVSSENKKDIARGLATAVSIEQESIDFYSRWAKKVSNPNAKNFFNFLVIQEQGHLEAINELKASIESDGSWVLPKMPKEDFSPFAPADWDKGEENAVTAVLFALWKEREAREFYFKVAAGVIAPNGKKFFELLAAFEQEHADFLGEYVEESFYSNELIMG